jgi:hypothetical protein
VDKHNDVWQINPGPELGVQRQWRLITNKCSGACLRLIYIVVVCWLRRIGTKADIAQWIKGLIKTRGRTKARKLVPVIGELETHKNHRRALIVEQKKSRASNKRGPFLMFC